MHPLCRISNGRVFKYCEIHPTESYAITKAATKEATMAPTCKDFRISVTSLRPLLVEEACEPVLVLVAGPFDTAEELSRVII